MLNYVIFGSYFLQCTCRQPPSNDGGSPVIEYFLEQKISSDFRWSPVTTSQIIETNFVVDKLRTGKEYSFRVAAANKAGTGKWSTPSEDVLCKAPIGMFTFYVLLIHIMESQQSVNTGSNVMAILNFFTKLMLIIICKLK